MSWLVSAESRGALIRDVTTVCFGSPELHFCHLITWVNFKFYEFKKTLFCLPPIVSLRYITKLLVSKFDSYVSSSAPSSFVMAAFNKHLRAIHIQSISKPYFAAFLCTVPNPIMFFFMDGLRQTRLGWSTTFIPNGYSPQKPPFS